MKTLKEQLEATGCQTVKEWLECHPGEEFQLWLPGITAFFSLWSETQAQICFKGRGEEKILRYINPKSKLHGFKMRVIIKFSVLEDEFLAAEAEANAAEKSFRANPTKWGGHRPSPAHIIYRCLARKDEVLLNNK